MLYRCCLQSAAFLSAADSFRPTENKSHLLYFYYFLFIKVPDKTHETKRICMQRLMSLELLFIVIDIDMEALLPKAPSAKIHFLHHLLKYLPHDIQLLFVFYEFIARFRIAVL